MECFRSLSILVFILCKANLAQGQADSYYELWTSKFKAVQLEMQVLSGKVIKAEKQITKTRSDLTKLGLTCSATTQVSEGKEKARQIAEDRDVRNPYAMLKRAFMDQNLYIHHLEENLRASFDESKTITNRCMTHIDELEAKHGEKIKEIEAKHGKRIKRIKEIEAKHGQRIDEIETEHQMEARETQTKFNQSYQDMAKVEETQARLEKIVNEMQSKLRAIQSENSRLNSSIGANKKAIDGVQGRRCQSGEFGQNYMLYVAYFNPPFQKKPHFMYGLRSLDTSSGFDNLRLKALVITLTRYRVRVKLLKPKSERLRGFVYQWMACP